MSSQARLLPATGERTEALLRRLPSPTAIFVLVLGVILIAMWLKSKLDPPPTVDEVVADMDLIPAEKLPGRWYPFAVLAIFVLLLIWIQVWRKVL